MWVPTHVYIHHKETKTFFKVYTESTYYFSCLYMCVWGPHDCGGWRAVLGVVCHFLPCLVVVLNDILLICLLI